MTDDSLPPERPRWVKPQITAAPKIRQIYWCDFWQDARMPEMWKTRPVIVMSYKNKLSGPCLVVPTSTEPQSDNPWAQELSILIDGRSISWAICNQLCTLSPSRFTAFKGKIPLLPEAEFNQVLDKVMKWLPKPFTIAN